MIFIGIFRAGIHEKYVFHRFDEAGKLVRNTFFIIILKHRIK